MDLQRVTSHPVHIIDEEGKLSPTALIPFCSMYDNYSAMGIKIDIMDVPVCNSFRPKTVRDQLCYTVDLDLIKHKIKSNEKVFFSFFIDYNEDREFTTENEKEENNGITIDSIGRKIVKLRSLVSPQRVQ